MKCGRCGANIGELPEIHAANLLVCEGPSDANFFTALLQSRHIDGVTVWPAYDPKGGAYGRSAIGRAFKQVRGTSGSENIRRIVIATDNDHDQAASFLEVRDQLVTLLNEPNQLPAQRRFPVPTAANATVTENDVSLTVLMIPPGAELGCLETMVFATAPEVHPENAGHVEQLAMNTNVANWHPQKQAKMKATAFFACTHMRAPDISLGRIWQSTHSSYLAPIESPVFEPLATRLQQLFT